LSNDKGQDFILTFGFIFTQQDENEQKPEGGELAKYLDRNYWQGQPQTDLGTKVFLFEKNTD
jgi:hypothetical protein